MKTAKNLSSSILTIGCFSLAIGALTPYGTCAERPAITETRVIAQAGSNEWTPTGKLTTPRTAHTATLLANGKVLAAGGWGTVAGVGTAVLDTAELYDPATATWTATGRLDKPRSSHTETLLPDGSVLVVGTYAAAERYDPSNGRWTSAGSMTTNTGRSGHTATLLQDGGVLVAGGNTASGAPLDSAEIYAPKANTGAIGPGFTGAWFDPAQSGHGLFIEILSGKRFYASWFAYDPAGAGQAWFTGVGTYVGNTASSISTPSLATAAEA